MALSSAPRPLGCPSPPYPALCLSLPPPFPASPILIKPHTHTPLFPGIAACLLHVCTFTIPVPGPAGAGTWGQLLFTPRAAAPPSAPAWPVVGIARCAIEVTSVRLGCGSPGCGQVSQLDGTTTLSLARGKGHGPSSGSLHSCCSPPRPHTHPSPFPCG